ncbi:hypothetical protein F4777DRAFT_527676 [Nemania sp. FL0916]|nr:hypothetical protein F4777DRAFT_527676 [Nemania sp. FL0916]
MSDEDHAVRVTCAKLALWYSTLLPRRVDVVGDFGGKQLFLIDGDSLLHYSIVTSAVDFDVGFQLLHVIYAVESYLHGLQVRGCNFQVIFFENHKPLCASSTTSARNRYKYQITRAILIRHLQRPAITTSDDYTPDMVFSFPSIDSTLFHHHLAENPAAFLLCHDGQDVNNDSVKDLIHTTAFQYMIHQFFQLSHSVALIGGTEFKSSRVIFPIITAARKMQDLTPPQTLWSYSNLSSLGDLPQFDWNLYNGNSYSELVIAGALSRILTEQSAEQHKLMALAIALHSVIIRHTCLTERTMAAATAQNADAFLRNFCREALVIIESDLGSSMTGVMNWDIFDMVDGRLFLSLYNVLAKGGLIPAVLVDQAKPLLTCIENWSGVSLLECSSQQISNSLTVKGPTMALSSSLLTAPIPPFDHEMLNAYLTSVHIQTTQILEGVNECKVFQELTHWHNAKRAVDPKAKPKKLGFFAMRRAQRFMADTLAYSASLTNATGKFIEPKTIVRAPARPLKKAPPKQTIPNSSKKPPGHGAKKKTRTGTGKESAHEAALFTQARKLEKKNTATFRHWKTLCDEFSQETMLAKRFQKATKHFLNLNHEDRMTIGAEVSLYMCDTLFRASENQANKFNGIQALGIRSLLFNQVMQTSLLPGLTEEASAVLQIISSAVGISRPGTPKQQMVSRKLSFHPRVYEPGNRVRLPLGTLEFQLGYCGPFLERTFDSRKDHRVSFEPDAWQRSVLDSIDANDSLFIVAPTSSGKTFISFYAMEAILRADDDGVLVYVAPTKALVNQIAAEIQARFRKTYHHEGRCVWAIHTRDYRVNSSHGCQVLVTVPHILQIMLLSPTHVNSWTKRVKRIIFDEVHCIGQADDGIIWEQLLLMAPCPIIALSATVGNPEEFYEWLRLSQASKGFNLKMVTHNTRYSDLRAFQYIPSQGFEFKGLHRPENFPVPGLDRPNRTCTNFRFIHPIAALINRTSVDLGELSLEPRDALTLWECMKKFQTPRFPLSDALDPARVFSDVPKKSEVLAWAAKLKAVLNIWMQDKASPFDKVQNSLKPDLQSVRNQKDVAEQAEAKGEQMANNQKLSVFALLCDLHQEDCLPAILFDYDRVECERKLEFALRQLEAAEQDWKNSSKEWKRDIRDYEIWKASQDKDRKKAAKPITDKRPQEEQIREEANIEISPWELFDPIWPLDQFSFADSTRLARSELEDFIVSLKGENIRSYLFAALKRGLAVHHAGMNRRYRSIVEILFRKGYLTAVIATGTLALGINMPCKTVAFVGDSAYLTTLNYRQGSGRAGRRGFDLLGNVVFSNIDHTRACELMSSRLPDLKGHFPLTTTLILRVLGLIEGAGQSSFVSGMVKALLTQNRVYLGGEEAGKSVQHHLRFSIAYLQSQHLISADGRPVNFAGLVGHLYFTENAVFAFHSLLKGGYFHRLCSNAAQDPTYTLRTLGLVLAHLFCRVPGRTSDSKGSKTPFTDPGSLILPRLPKDAEDLLINHNKETLAIFKTYASTYIGQYLGNTPDRHLPLTRIPAGGEESRMLDLPDDLPPTKVRSPFSALSGHSDNFSSIHEMCANIRSGVFLEESAVPYIPIWPHDLPNPLNSYIYDFLKHGDYTALTRDNKIKQGDVWFHLRDFSLVLATIIASLTNFIRADSNLDDTDMIDLDSDSDSEIIVLGSNGDTPDEDTSDRVLQTSRDAQHDTVRTKPTKKKVVDSWDDEDDATSEEDVRSEQARGTSTPASSEPPMWEKDGSGLARVLRAFVMLKADFDEKFHKAWA